MQPLLGGPRADLDEATVTAALDNPSPKVRHGVTVLDSDDAETGETLPVDWQAGGDVTWAFRAADQVAGVTEDPAQVRRDATIALAGDVDEDLLIARRFLLWTELQATDGTWVRWHLGVFVPTLPAIRDDGTVVRRDLHLADKTWLWQQAKLDEPAVVPADTEALSDIAADLSNLFGESALFPTSTAVLPDDLFIDAGTSYLEKWNREAAAAGYDQIVCNEDGRPTTVALADLAGKGSERTYGPGYARIVPGGDVEALAPDMPNVVRFVARQGPPSPAEEDGWVTVRNQSTGPASIDQRGYEVFRTVDVDASEQDTLEAVASAEAQRVFKGGGLRFRGRVGLCPAHSDRDVVTFIRPRLGLSGPWLVTEWRYPLREMGSEDAALMDITAEAKVAVS